MKRRIDDTNGGTADEPAAVACNFIRVASVGSVGSVGDAGAVADVGRLVDSGQAEDRRMIRLVKERRLLYARNNMPVASYYAQVKALWQEVADEMGWTVAHVRRKWSHVRNSYSRHLRNEMQGARTGKGRVVSKWYLADELQFLKEHMATDMRPTSFSGFAPNFLEMDLNEDSSGSEQVEMKPFIHTPWFTLPAPQPPHTVTAMPSGPGPVKHSENKYEPQFCEDSSSSQAFGSDENSSYFQFFRGIYNDYQELTAKKQRQFKRQCLAMLHELLEQQEGEAGEVGYAQEQRSAINLSQQAVPQGGAEGAAARASAKVEPDNEAILPHDLADH